MTEKAALRALVAGLVICTTFAFIFTSLEHLALATIAVFFDVVLIGVFLALLSRERPAAPVAAPAPADEATRAMTADAPPLRRLQFPRGGTG